MKEIWKQVVKWGITVPGYKVSNYGRVKTARGNILKNSVKKDSGTNRIDRCRVTLQYEQGLFDYNHRSRKNESKRVLDVAVHRLVIEAFKPIDLFPPIPIEEWNSCPESAKKIMRLCCIVDHIDNNPLNNMVTNLRWCTPIENSKHRKMKEFLVEQNLEYLSNDESNSLEGLMV